MSEKKIQYKYALNIVLDCNRYRKPVIDTKKIMKRKLSISFLKVIKPQRKQEKNQ